MKKNIGPALALYPTPAVVIKRIMPGKAFRDGLIKN